MSGKAMSWSRTVKVGSSSAKQVLRELCISQNELTGQCTLSINSLIKITELSETTVLKALAILKARGFIHVEKVKTQNGWGNSYSFPLMESTPKNEGTPNSRDTPKIEGSPSFEGEGTPNSRDTGTPKTRDLKKEEKREKSMYAPSVEVAHTSVSSKVQEPAHVKEPAHVQETASRCAGSCTADVQEPAHRRDQLKEANRGAAKTEKTQRNSLIQKENRGAPLMAPSPADSTSEIASKSLIQKENEGADTPARTYVKKAAKVEPQGSRFTLEELPDNWHSECRRIQPKADPAKVFEEFRDHWIAQPGAKGRKSDWTATWRNWCRRINARDLERVGYEPGRSQFMVKPEPVNPFKVTPQNCPPRQKTEEELEAERSFDLFERVLNGEV